MSNNIIIYSGPTITHKEIKSIIKSAKCEAPIQCGDILKLLDKCNIGDSIVIIDGYFSCVASVWHKEILSALEKGVLVYGASSIGALRASELSLYGMHGVGYVFQQYESGVIEDDDEVAVMHLDSNYNFLPISIPMINIRVTMEEAWESGVIDKVKHDAIIKRAKQLFYPERSWENILPDILSKQEYSIIMKWVSLNFINIKKIDAIKLLNEVAANKRCKNPQKLNINKTVFYKRLKIEIKAEEEVANNKLNALLFRSSLSIASLNIKHIYQINSSSEIECIYEFLSYIYDIENLKLTDCNIPQLCINLAVLKNYLKANNLFPSVNYFQEVGERLKKALRRKKITISADVFEKHIATYFIIQQFLRNSHDCFFT